MPRASFKCPKCSRTFSMAAHLARHMNTIHKRGGKKRKAAGGRKKRRKRKAMRRPTAAKRGPAAARGTSGTGVRRVLGEMEAYYKNLLAERQGLDSQIESIEAAIDTVNTGGPARSAGPGRPRRARRGRPRMARRGGRRRGPGRPKAARRGRPKGAGRRGRRAGRAGSLKDMIVQVLRKSSRPLSPRDIAKNVMSAGYPTKAKDLTKAVSNTLPDLKGVKRVGFGQYAA